MGADGAGDKGQGVLLGNEPQGILKTLLTAQLNVFRNILLNGTAAFAGRGEAVQQGNLFI